MDEKRIKDTNNKENKAIDQSQLQLAEVISQLQSFAVLLKGFTFQDTQTEDLAGLGLTLEKITFELQEINDLLSSAFNRG